MALGLEFCFTSKSSKQRGLAQHQSSRKNGNSVDLSQANTNNNNTNNNNNNQTNGINNNGTRNSQHSFREHHTTPTTTATTTTTTPPHPNSVNLSPHPNMDPTHHLDLRCDIRYVRRDYHAQIEDELSVKEGDFCILRYTVEDDRGRSWSYVLSMGNNTRGFVPSDHLTIEKPKYLKKITRPSLGDHPVNNGQLHHNGHHPNHHQHHPHHHQSRGIHTTPLRNDPGHLMHHHHGHPQNHHSHHHHGSHHNSGVAPTVISNAAVGGGVGNLISRGPTCEVNKVAQCISDKTCPSNGNSIRFSPLDVDHLVPPALADHQSRIDIPHHANMLRGSSSGCQTFQDHTFNMHHMLNPSYYNLAGPPPTQEPPYDRFRSHANATTAASADFIPFERDEPGELYVVLFNFVQREERDISVKPGDYIHVLNKDDADWYWVRRDEDNREGFVPSQFIFENDKVESILNKGNSTITMRSSNNLELHTYINGNQVLDRKSLLTDQHSSPCQQL